MLIAVVQLLGCTEEKVDNTVAPVPEASTAGPELRAGEAAPQFTLRSLKGEPVSLADLRGRTVLLNFWATWCIPCVAEMPALQRIYKKYGERGFTILAVSADQDVEVVRSFAEQNGLTFPILLDSDMSVVRSYGVSGFPETFFIDGHGNLLRVRDVETGDELVRIISDRPWDAEPYLELLETLLPVDRDR